ncbi:MAG TPA: NUDIX domain-containing protein [Chloroflexota bacterium]|nr:NUDIX domain-containing protein [Chloroflexota bacterium]
MHGLTLPDPGEPRFCGRCGQELEFREDGGRARPRCPVCGWTYYAKPALGAAVFIEEDGRLLLVQRANEPYKGWWMLPAGFVEYGEDAGETAAREALEETGLTVEITGVRGLYFGAGDPRGASHLAVFNATRHNGTPVAGDDACDARWFAPGEVPDEIAFEGHRRAIAQWQKGKRVLTDGASLLDYSAAGPAPPIVVYVVIENPKGTVNRTVYDDEAGAFVPTGEIFNAPLPIHYGWIPRTISEGDGRELDVTVVGEGEAAVGSVIAARPIGALLRADADHKVLAIRADMPSAYASVMEAAERPELTGMIDDLFRPRATLLGWASVSETRRLIHEAQRAWIRAHRTGT